VLSNGVHFNKEAIRHKLIKVESFTLQPIPSGRKREPTAARLLELRVRIQPEEFMCASGKCCVVT
jgi:hypothetical protein